MAINRLVKEVPIRDDGYTWYLVSGEHDFGLGRPCRIVMTDCVDTPRGKARMAKCVETGIFTLVRTVDEGGAVKEALKDLKHAIEDHARDIKRKFKGRRINYLGAISDKKALGQINAAQVACAGRSR
ncbi:MAG: hypothetical protein LBI17_00845 [Rickettsiales bacterium]|jgi:hypothetical protein|nr:hypothetical protein [Rickettsiales bacterium]